VIITYGRKLRRRDKNFIKAASWIERDVLTGNPSYVLEPYCLVSGQNFESDSVKYDRDSYMCYETVLI